MFSIKTLEILMMHKTKFFILYKDNIKVLFQSHHNFILFSDDTNKTQLIWRLNVANHASASKN